jgi:homocysteine S-methyltransferase
VNCSEGPEQVLRLVEQMRRAWPEAPLIAQPNAGGPQRTGDRIMFSATPAYFASYASAFRAAGVWLIGGCCGTQPQHIRAMATALAQPSAHPVIEVEETPAEPAEAAVDIEPTAFARALASGRRVISVEMEPPRGFSPARTVAGAETLRAAGADVVNVADSPMARMRMSPWAVCHLIQDDAGIETVLHFPTRGRNILRVQGDLLAAHALGIRNIFAVMGDSTSIGDFPEAADLSDVTPSGLIALIKGNLNAGQDRAGGSIGEATGFVVACALNLNAADLRREARVLKRKIDAGADVALTQPIFDPAVLDKFQATYEESHGPLTLPVLVGLLPLMSRRHAEFLHNEVPGIEIPGDVRDRIGVAGDERGEGLRLARELADALAGRTSGVYLIPPFRRYDLAAELVEQLRADG